MNERNLDCLRSLYEGKIYIYLKSADVEQEFYADAQLQGYRFGSYKPSETPLDNIISLEPGRQLSHVNFIGRIAFQSSHDLIRVDYAAFKSGAENFILERPKIS